MTEKQKTDVENAIKSISIDFDKVAEEINKDIAKQKEELKQKEIEYVEIPLSTKERFFPYPCEKKSLGNSKTLLRYVTNSNSKS